MGKPDGFMTVERQNACERPPQVRLCDWDAFHPMMEEDALREQSMRCMNCGTPFCHGGVVVNGVASGCSLGNLIPEWNDLVYRKLYREAYERLAMTSPFPEFTSRVCPALCEGACTAGLNGKAVTVREIERFLSDSAWEKGWVNTKAPEKRTGKRVAVVGSGPAGLAAAHALNAAGHSVTVIEKADRPGGLLMYGIPNMKLPKDVVLRRAEVMAKQGIEFAFNKDAGAMGKELDAFDAVVFCAGAGEPRDITVPGRELNGVHFAVPYLSAATKALLGKGDLKPLTGKKVVVIGGGDTGNDCVGTTLRQGAIDIVQIEILPQPPENRTEANAWPQWPLTCKTDYGQQEAISVIGHDPRLYCVTATKFVGKDGKVTAVETVNVEWVRGENGRMMPKNIPGSEKTIEADLVLIAAGFTGAEKALLSALGNPKAEGYSFSKPNWFTAGDFRTGQSLVVKAINDGLEAAKRVIDYLG